jgi:hypothetical protein
MTRLAEAEAWVRRNRRLIHNQPLIQFLSVIAIIMPLPMATLVFWAAFGLASPLVIQSLIGAWTAAIIIYASMAVYTKIEHRKL